MSSQAAFNARAFIGDQFGSPQRLIGLLQAYGVRPPHHAAVVKWKIRNQIPAEWLPPILYLVELDTGSPVSLAAYVVLVEGQNVAQ